MVAVSTAVRKVVNVLEIEPSFVGGLDASAAAAARRVAITRCETLAPGPWEKHHYCGKDHAGDFGLLVVEGLMSRRVEVGGQECTELLGSGDLIRPWDDPDELASTPAVTRWTVLERTTVALIDERFVGRICPWPPVLAAIAKRMMERTQALAFHLAVCHMTRVDERLLVVLWHLADRWGRVTSEGVVLPLPLTHDMLAQIVGARRPTVTTALQELSGRAVIVRNADRNWLLRGEPPRELHDIRAQVAA